MSDDDGSICLSEEEILDDREDEDEVAIVNPLNDTSLPRTTQFQAFQPQPFKCKMPIGAAIEEILPAQDLDNPLFWFDKFWTERMTTVVVHQTNHFSSQSVAELSPSKDVPNKWELLSTTEWDSFISE